MVHRRDRPGTQKKALNYLNIDWLDRKEFSKKRSKIVRGKNEKEVKANQI
jgi:hypothetical protein